MRAPSKKLWLDFFAGFERVSLYTVDPGAYAVAVELAPLLEDAGRLDAWFVEGWSANRRSGCTPAIGLERALGPGRTLMLGSQTDYGRTQAVLRQAADARSPSVFLFDHWKNYGAHFAGRLLPDVIVVPDATARRDLLAAIGDDAANRVKILPHPGIEASAERVIECGSAEEGTVALLLDPTELSDGLGYDWRSTLTRAVEVARRRNVRLLVKPHPRQNAVAVGEAIAALDDSGEVAKLSSLETERTIARAQEVWGMTTTALNVALAVGKPIRSFQIGRNAVGAQASNPHIEPFAIVQ